MDHEGIKRIILKRMKVAEIDAICGGRGREKGNGRDVGFMPFLGGGGGGAGGVHCGFLPFLLGEQVLP